MKPQPLFLAAVGLGLLLIVAGWLWPLLVPRDAIWDEQRAAKFAAASVELHEAIHEGDHGHDHGGGFRHRHHDEHLHDHEEEIASAQNRYASARAELQRAHMIQDAVPRYLRWAGIFLGGIGAIGFFFGRKE